MRNAVLGLILRTTLLCLSGCGDEPPDEPCSFGMGVGRQDTREDPSASCAYSDVSRVQRTLTAHYTSGARPLQSVSILGATWPNTHEEHEDVPLRFEFMVDHGIYATGPSNCVATIDAVDCAHEDERRLWIWNVRCGDALPIPGGSQGGRPLERIAMENVTYLGPCSKSPF